MKRILTTLIVMLLITGCVPKSYVIFINGTEKNVTIEVTDVGTDYDRGSLQLGPGSQSGQIEMPFARVVVTVEGNPKPYTQDVPRLDPGRRYAKPSERLVHLLVTETAVHAIPLEFRKNWKEHVNDIVGKEEMVQPAGGAYVSPAAVETSAHP